jgi:hypothetical protein
MPGYVWDGKLWDFMDRYEGGAIKSIDHVEGSGGPEVHFNMEDGSVVLVCHDQNCCESVGIDKMDKEDLAMCIGDGPVTFTRTVGRSETVEGTYTFITLQSQHNNATFSFRGESNGYYSEEAEMKVGVPTKDG